MGTFGFFVLSVLASCVAGEYLRPVEKLMAFLASKRDNGKI